MTAPKRRLTDEVRAANRARAQKLADEAPPLKDWQIQILAPRLGPVPQRKPRRRPAA